jgi:hypothetical protein
MSSCCASRRPMPGVRNAHARLGTTGHILRLSARALDAPAHDQHRGVTVRPSEIANRCIPPLQEDRERRGDDLEAAVRCREVMASTERTTLDESGLRGKTIQRRSRCAHENAADKGSRLDLFTRLLTEPQESSRCVLPNITASSTRVQYKVLTGLQPGGQGHQCIAFLEPAPDSGAASPG